MSIGSVLAQTGANIGGTLGSGMSGLGGAARGMLTTAGQGISRRRMEKEARELLEAHKDNPAALLEASRKFAMQGNQQMAAVFQQAASSATQRQVQSAVGPMLASASTTPEQMLQTAQQLNSLGKTQEAMQLAAKARELQATTQAGIALQARKESIAESARKLGLDELAERALNTTDEESLRAIQKDLRDFEIKEVIRTRGVPGRKALARNAGIEYEPYMSELTDDNFAKLLEGADAQLKAFIGPDGKEQMLEVNKQGRVMDPESGKFVRASELGLRPAVQRQVVENIANFKSEKLAEAGIKHFSELHADTVTVVQSLNNIEEVLPLTDEMIAGATAQPELFVRRIKSELSDFLGLNPEDVALTNTEQYIALAAPRVADIIKAFGAGTGLSDADREFANKAAAGDISMTVDSLQRILKILKKAGETKVEMYNQTVEAMQKDGLNPVANGFVLPARTTRTPPSAPPADVAPPAGFVEDVK